MNRWVLLTIEFCAAATLSGQLGALDSAFDSDGIVITALGNVSDAATSIVIQPDGKIVVAGRSRNGTHNDFGLVRYNENGSLDTNFGDEGFAITSIGPDDDTPFSLALMSDGRIVAAGFMERQTGSLSEFAVARYDANGSLDSSFGGDGMVTTAIGTVEDRAWSMALQQDGRIVLAGFSRNDSTDYDFALARYNGDGTLDSSFGFDGIITTDIRGKADGGYAVVIKSDGAILVAGSSDSDTSGVDFALVKYESDGSIDSSFGENGIAITELGGNSDPYSMAIQIDGRILVAGTSGKLVLVRYTPRGTLDTTFGSYGVSKHDLSPYLDIPYSIAIQNDGKIVVAATSHNSPLVFSMVRYLSDGTLEQVVSTDILPGGAFATGIALQSDQKIVVVGGAIDGTVHKFAVVRYLQTLNTGIINFSPGNNSVLIYPNPIKETATLEYTLKQAETITIELIDLQGRTLTTFVDGQQQDVGEHQQLISMPSYLPSGSYLVVISSPRGSVTVQVVK